MCWNTTIRSPASNSWWWSGEHTSPVLKSLHICLRSARRRRGLPFPCRKTSPESIEQIPGLPKRGIERRAVGWRYVRTQDVVEERVDQNEPSCWVKGWDAARFASLSSCDDVVIFVRRRSGSGKFIVVNGQPVMIVF